MITKPLVSIIIPVFNVARYLSQCLESVREQTYQNVEILIIDDSSTDGSKHICDEYAGRDGRAKVFHVEHRGVSAARNCGLDHAQGEVIAFLDSDDWMEPQTLEILIKNIQKYNADIVACRAYKEWVNKTETSVLPDKLSLFNSEEALFEYVVSDHLGAGVWNKIYKASLFAGLRYPEGCVHEEIIILYQLLSKAQKLVWIPDILYHYRQRRSSICHKQDLKRLHDLCRARLEIYEALEERGEQYRNKLLIQCLWSGGKYWLEYFGLFRKATKAELKDIDEMTDCLSAFATDHLLEVLQGDFSNMDRLLCLMILCKHPTYMWLLHEMYRLYTTVRKRSEDDELYVLYA